MLDRKKLNWDYCCRGRSCCPQVAVQDDDIFIKDDDQNVIRLTIEQLNDIIRHLDERRET